MSVRILRGDCRKVLAELPDASVHCCVTSPPYFGLRDYGVKGRIGLESTPDAFVAELVAAFREVRRVLRDDGTLWLNVGDSYANVGKWGGATSGKHAKDLHGVQQSSGRVRETSLGLVAAGYKPKDLIGIPWRVAFALQADGWYLRQDIIWHKPNAMPESVRDRCTKAHEYLFLLSKSKRYYFDSGAIQEPAVGLETRNKRSVWTVATKPFKGAHFATFPSSLIEPCIAAGCPEGGTVLDPFGGAGTTGLVADRMNRSAVLVELNHSYAGMAHKRLQGEGALFADVETA